MEAYKERIVLSWILMLMFFVNILSPAAIAFSDNIDQAISQDQNIEDKDDLIEAEDKNEIEQSV